jgi:hypothetical protein
MELSVEVSRLVDEAAERVSSEFGLAGRGGGSLLVLLLYSMSMGSRFQDGRRRFEGDGLLGRFKVKWFVASLHRMRMRRRILVWMSHAIGGVE